MPEPQGPRIRYFLTQPNTVSVGMWRIRAAEITIDGELQTNYIVAEFSIHLPNAEEEVRGMLERLNS